MNPAIALDFTGFEAVLFDDTQSLYAASPPELIVADFADATQTLIVLSWEDPDRSIRMGMNGSIDSITVPEPSVAFALGAGALGLGRCALSRRARSVRRNPAV